MVNEAINYLVALCTFEAFQLLGTNNNERSDAVKATLKIAAKTNETGAL